MKLKSIKTQLIIYLICLAVFLSIKDKDISFLFTTAIAVISALLSESIILYLRAKFFQITPNFALEKFALRADRLNLDRFNRARRGIPIKISIAKFGITESSIITGLIIGYILYSRQSWMVFILASLAAVLSKHIIRFHKKHIFNPAAFGIFAVLLFGAETQWKSAYIWYILLPFGIYFVKKIKKAEILIGYAVVALGLFAAQAVLQKVPLWLIFGYLNYFYVFVMIIEPKTTPVTPIGKYCFGAGIAGLIFILTELGVKFDVELFSLLIMNMFVPLLNKLDLAKGLER